MNGGKMRCSHLRRVYERDLRRPANQSDTMLCFDGTDILIRHGHGRVFQV